MMGTMVRGGLWLLALLLPTACVPAGSRPARPAGRSTEERAVKMRHQILFSSPTRKDVFEGFMVLFEDAFYVKAFAGPGVELFTIARDRDRRVDILHIEGLEEQIDIKRVGDDIHRVYLEGCGPVEPASVSSCTVDNESIEERFDAQGNLIQRTFPAAHGIGLTVTYSGYKDWDGRSLPKKTTLEWGGGGRREMVIVMLSVAPADGEEKSVLTSLLSASR